MVNENTVPDDEYECRLIVRTKLDARDAFETYDLAVEELLSSVSLPLSESLGVSSENVSAKSQEILETLLRLRHTRNVTIDAAEEKIDDYVNRFPEEEREEIRARIAVTGIMI